MRVFLPKDHHIARLVDRKTHRNVSVSRGWQVRICRRGISINEYLADNKYGGKAGALSEAMHFRDAKLRELRPIPRSEIARRKIERNTSGIPSVRRRIKPQKRGDQVWEYVVWTASASLEPNKRKTRDFYVNKCGGEDEAREAAIAQRLRWERVMARNEKQRVPSC